MEGNDLVAAALKGIAGAVPVVGPLMAEIIATTIPNQKWDRLEKLLEELEKKFEGLDKEVLHMKLQEPEAVDLLEDALLQTTRALTPERIDYIASLLKNSLTQEELDHLQYKRLLSILAELNDVEVIILISKSYHRRMCQEESTVIEFFKKHESILQEKFIHTASPPADREKNALFHSYRANLVRLGLLRYRYKRIKKGEQPEYDQKTGAIKTEGIELTTLGKLLLREIDQNEVLLQN